MELFKKIQEMIPSNDLSFNKISSHIPNSGSGGKSISSVENILSKIVGNKTIISSLNFSAYKLKEGYALSYPNIISKIQGELNAGTKICYFQDLQSLKDFLFENKDIKETFGFLKNPIYFDEIKGLMEKRINSISETNHEDGILTGFSKKIEEVKFANSNHYINAPKI